MNLGYLYTRFDGRIPRRTYWLASIPLWIVMVTIGTVEYAWTDGFSRVAEPGYRLVLFLVGLAMWYPTSAVIVKRLHDRDRDGRLVLILIAPFLLFYLYDLLGWSDPSNPKTVEDVLAVLTLVVGLVFLVELGFRRGTVGPNQYGPDPLEPLVPSVRAPA